MPVIVSRRSLLTSKQANGKAKPFRTSGGGAEEVLFCDLRTWRVWRSQNRGPGSPRGQPAWGGGSDRMLHSSLQGLLLKLRWNGLLYSVTRTSSVADDALTRRLKP